MRSHEKFRVALVGALTIVLSACATGPDVFERHAMYPAIAAPVPEASAYCPVVLSNRTDQQIDAGYTHAGVQSTLGLIPAGRSLSFRVSCGAGALVAHGVASSTAFLGDPNEYRAIAEVDDARETRVDFTVANRIR
jgi:hypothetical protein